MQKCIDQHSSSAQRLIASCGSGKLVDIVEYVLVCRAIQPAAHPRDDVVSAYATMSASFCLSVRLSVTEVHCGHGACREEGRSYLALC